MDRVAGDPLRREAWWNGIFTWIMVLAGAAVLFAEVSGAWSRTMIALTPIAVLVVVAPPPDLQRVTARPVEWLGGARRPGTSHHTYWLAGAMYRYVYLGLDPGCGVGAHPVRSHLDIDLLTAGE